MNKAENDDDKYVGYLYYMSMCIAKEQHLRKEIISTKKAKLRIH